MDLLQPWHIIILVLVAILLFGGRKLPELGKGLGEGLRGFKEGMKGISDPTSEPNAKTTPGETAHIVTPQPTAPAAASVPVEQPKPPAV